jgi:HEAT repeat protein
MALNDKEKAVRVAAAEAVASLGPLEPADLPVVLKVVKGGDLEVRVAAARALGRFPTQGKQVIPVLVETYQGSTDAPLRCALLASLAQFGDEVKDAAAILSDAVKSGNPELIRAAGPSLAKMGPEAQKLVKQLSLRLEDADPATRKELLAALRSIGPAAKDAAPSLVKILKDKDHEARLAALGVVEAFAKDAKGAVPALIQLFEDKDLETRVSNVLAKVGADAVPDLVIALRDSNAQIRMGAVKTLGNLGPVARQASKALYKVYLTDPYLTIRLEAESAYKRVR